MQLETPAYPHTLAQWAWILVASAFGYAASLLEKWINKKRSPAEERKTDAEARQVEVATDLSLMQAASEALTRACRMQDERDHWQRKADSLQRQVELLNIEIESMDSQMRRQEGFIKWKGLKSSEQDVPKE